MIEADLSENAAPAAAYWTKEQARAFLGGVSERTLERMRIRHYRVRGLVRYHRDDIVEFMERHAVQVVTPRSHPKTKTPAQRSHRGTTTPALDDFLNG